MLVINLYSKLFPIKFFLLIYISIQEIFILALQRMFVRIVKGMVEKDV